VYRYRSGKPVKSGENGASQYAQEVIECKVENLTVVATANIGANYGVFSVDEAFWKRFRIIRSERTGKDERQILTNASAHLGRGAIYPIDMLLPETRRAVKSGNLQYPACIRTLTRICTQATSVDELAAGIQFLCTEELTGWTEDGAVM